jgi:hypothetical protein
LWEDFQQPLQIVVFGREVFWDFFCSFGQNKRDLGKISIEIRETPESLAGGITRRKIFRFTAKPGTKKPFAA